MAAEQKLMDDRNQTDISFLTTISTNTNTKRIGKRNFYHAETLNREIKYHQYSF